ncbi:uncharacterized protein [Amphiura filiformis]|uniref:uncharacterized protein n=1 Tax=Amphiura filiformis TaxID=82378 RepID=UPI003B21E819
MPSFPLLQAPGDATSAELMPSFPFLQAQDKCLGDPYIDFGKLGVGAKYSIYSSGWPGEYANNNTCLWHVSAPDGYVVHAHLKSFHLEQTYDFVTIGEGVIEHYRKSQLTKLTGTHGRKIYTSAYPSMWIQFLSDYTVRDNGFEIELYIQNAYEVRDPCVPSQFDCAVGVCLNVQETRCDGVAECMNFKDEYFCDDVTCDDDGYLCNSMNMYNFTPCVTPDELCDRSFDCPSKDDESICHIIACPHDCDCQYITEDYQLDIKCNRDWSEDDVNFASRTTRVLELSGGIHPELTQGLFANRHVDLKALSLVFNHIEEIHPGTFEGLNHLTWLNLSFNEISVLRKSALKELPSLQGLVLWHVPIRVIESSAFDGLEELRILVLVTNTREAVLTNADSWAGLRSLTHLYVDNHRLCCQFNERHMPGECISISPHTPLFHCGHLFQNPLIRLFFWGSAILTILMNGFLLLWKTSRLWRDAKEKPHRVQNYFVWNLGVANICMGIHLAVLCAADFYYAKDYYVFSEEWWVSIPCRFAGFLSLLSAEACVFFLLLISIDVYIRVKNLESEKRMDIKTARWASLGVWVAAGIIALTGSLAASVDSEFYYLSDFCIGLPMIRRPSNFIVEEGNAESPFGNRTISIQISRGTKPAWALSIFLFLVLHLICFIIAVILYRENKEKVATLRAQWRKERREEQALREEEYRREMEEDGLDSNEEDGGASIRKTKDDDRGDYGEQENEINQGVAKTEEQSIEPANETDKKNTRKSSKKGRSFKLSQKLSLRKKKRSKQKVRRTDKKDTADAKDVKVEIRQPGDNGTSDDEDSSKEIRTISKSLRTEKGSDIEADIHSDTESKKQSDIDDINDDTNKGSDSESSDISVAESEIEPYDKQTCRMYGYMRFTLYFDIFCWSPLVLMAFLSQCGVDIPVIAYAYSAATLLPMVAYMTPIVIMFATCDCFGDPEIPEYIINSEGRCRQ